MKKDSRVFNGHIIESIELIEQYAKNLTIDKFKKEIAMQDAIIRRLEIIGEAVKNIPSAFKIKHPEVPWKQMAGMRDILIHEYFEVDLALTWSVVTLKLSPLKSKLQNLLSKQEETFKGK